MPEPEQRAVGVMTDFSGSFEQFGDFVRRMAESNFEQEGNVEPMAIVHNRNAAKVIIGPIDYSFLSSAEAKEAYGEQVIKPMAAAGSDMIAIVVGAWKTAPGSPAAKECQRIREAGEPFPSLPDLGLDGVEENVVAVLMCRESACIWSSNVTRSEDNAMIGKWEFGREIESHWYDAAQDGWRLHNE